MCAEVSSASFLLDSGTSSPRLPDYFVPIQEQPLEPAFVGAKAYGEPFYSHLPNSEQKQQQNVLGKAGHLNEKEDAEEEEDSCSTTSPPELSSSCNPPAPSYPPLISAPLEETEKMCAEVSSASFLLDSGTSSPRLPDYFVPIQNNL
uniref:Homeobox protein A2 n=1 Tax=Ditylenchus dipsaci TaxID=166011 RepID=A0A915DJD9_9BILA